MLERIRLDGGHAALSIGGHTYLPDATGAFEVPQEFAAELIRVHGGELDPGVERLEDNVLKVEGELAAAKNLVELKTKELSDSKERVAAYKKRREAAEVSHTQAPPPNKTLGVSGQQNARR